MIMKRVTFVLIGLVAIVVYLATTTVKFDDKIAQTNKVAVKKHPAKKLFD